MKDLIQKFLIWKFWIFCSKNPENATLEVLTNLKALKVCVQIIETLLKEYYIDTKFLELLKKENLMYRKISITKKEF